MDEAAIKILTIQVWKISRLVNASNTRKVEHPNSMGTEAFVLMHFWTLPYAPLPYCSSWLKSESVSCSFSPVWFFVTLWTVACQAPLLLGFSRQEFWSRLPFPTPGDPELYLFIITSNLVNKLYFFYELLSKLIKPGRGGVSQKPLINSWLVRAWVTTKTCERHLKWEVGGLVRLSP